MYARTRLATVIPLLALAVACGGSGSSPGGLSGPTTTPVPSTNPSTTAAPSATVAPSTTTPAPPVSRAVHVYYLRNEKVASVHRDVTVTSGAIAAAAVRALLTGPTSAERAQGLSTTIPAASRLLSLSLHQGTVSVNMNAAFESGGGSFAMRARLMQVVFTLTQFPTVQHVTFMVEGRPVTAFGGEGIVLDHPVARTDYSSFIPEIFIDSPAIGETVRSPLVVRGLASVFEGDFLVELTTASGKTLVRQHVHTMMGEHVAFTAELRFTPDRSGPGRLTGFDYSARDGSRIDDYVVPVQLG